MRNGRDIFVFRVVVLVFSFFSFFFCLFSLFLRCYFCDVLITTKLTTGREKETKREQAKSVSLFFD